MSYTKFADIPFHNRKAEKLKQIYSVLYFMRQGFHHVDAIHRSKESFPKGVCYSTIQDKCTRLFAGDMDTFVRWYESGVMLSKLRERNRLDENDTKIFAELLVSTPREFATNISKQNSTSTHHFSDYNAKVDTAFEVVLEEIENAVEGLNRDGAQAFKSGNYDLVKRFQQRGSQMTEFRDKVYVLQQEWNSIFFTKNVHIQKNIRRKKQSERLSRGLRTRETTFHIPILQALARMGGTAASIEVIKEIAMQVKPILNEYDLSSLLSSGVPRWENTAHWARYELVKNGFLAPDSPRGIWEITQKGREWLATHNDN